MLKALASAATALFLLGSTSGAFAQGAGIAPNSSNLPPQSLYGLNGYSYNSYGYPYYGSPYNGMYNYAPGYYRYGYARRYLHRRYWHY